MSETLALEIGHFGLRVVIIEPGYIAPGLLATGLAFGAATVTLVVTDAPNVGFNDPTPVAPLPTNPASET